MMIRIGILVHIIIARHIKLWKTTDIVIARNATDCYIIMLIIHKYCSINTLPCVAFCKQ